MIVINQQYNIHTYICVIDIVPILSLVVVSFLDL